MKQKFDAIICDPPWNFSDRLSMSSVKRGAAAHYDVMTNEDLLSLPIKDIANPDGAILALWVPSSMLQLGLDFMKAYGFRQTQTYIWVKSKKEPYDKLSDVVAKLPKVNMAKKVIIKLIDKFKLNDVLSFGMGHCFRNCHEICLIGFNNNKVYNKILNKSQRTVCIEPNIGHSIKPNNLHAALDAMLGNTAKKIEIFARRQYSNWHCIGNEIDGRDIREALAELI
jgi:N6-adenosine-specific RNA methylase IME4